MNEPEVSYRSFEEFQRKFYPVWFKGQESQDTQESFGRDLARYSMEKHFPVTRSKDTVVPKQRT